MRGQEPGGDQAHLTDANRLLPKLERAVALEPDDPEVRHNLADTLLTLGRAEEALVHVECALSSHPDNLALHFLQGRCLGDMGRFPESLCAFRRLVELAPGAAVAHFMIGSTLGAMDRPEEALDAFRQGLALDPSDPFAHYNAGLAAERLGRFEESVGAYREAVLLQPDFVDALLALGRAFDRLLRGAAAHPRPDPRPGVLDLASPETSYCLALAYLAMHEGQLAREEIERLASMDRALAAELQSLSEQVSEERPENAPLRRALSRAAHRRGDSVPGEVRGEVMRALEEAWLIVPTEGDTPDSGASDAESGALDAESGALDAESGASDAESGASFSIATHRVEGRETFVAFTDMPSARRFLPRRPVHRIVMAAPDLCGLILTIESAVPPAGGGGQSATLLVLNPGSPEACALTESEIRALAPSGPETGTGGDIGAIAKG